MASATVRPAGSCAASASRISRTPSVSPRCASIISTTTSASAAPPQAAFTMARSSRRRGRNSPGVSTKTSCASPSMAMPRIRVRVVCTLWVTIETLAPDHAVRAASTCPRSARRSARPARSASRPALQPRQHRLRRRLLRRALRGRPRLAPRRPSASRTSTEKTGAWSGPSPVEVDSRPAAAARGSAPIPAARSWRRARPARTAAIRPPQARRISPRAASSPPSR